MARQHVYPVVELSIPAQDFDVPFPALVLSAEENILPVGSQQAKAVTVKIAGCTILIITVSAQLTTMGVNFAIKL